MATFEEKLDVPWSWCEGLLKELAETHNVGFTCDRRGDFSRYVNRERREFLQEVLGLENVEYRVCVFCDEFVLEENAGEWGFDCCPECEDEEELAV